MGSIAALSFFLLSLADAAPALPNPHPPPPPLQIFLSHRGSDGRHKFTGHLDAALRRKGLNVFRDDRDIPRGENITEAIWRAIEESTLSIVRLSRGYASSKYCLDELVKIMQSRDQHRHRPFPIFDNVSPDDDVAHPSSSGCYKADFDCHKRMYSYERVDGWIHALHSISHISGWVITDHTPEAEMVESIAEEILREVKDMVGEQECDHDGDHRRRHGSIPRMGVAHGS